MPSVIGVCESGACRQNGADQTVRAVEDLISCLPVDKDGNKITPVSAMRRGCLNLCDYAPNAILRAPPSEPRTASRLDRWPAIVNIVLEAGGHPLPDEVQACCESHWHSLQARSRRDFTAELVHAESATTCLEMIVSSGSSQLPLSRLRAACTVSAGRALLSLGRGDEALTASESAISIGAKAAAMARASLALARERGSGAAAAAAAAAAAGGCEAEGGALPGHDPAAETPELSGTSWSSSDVHEPWEPLVLRADALLFLAGGLAGVQSAATEAGHASAAASAYRAALEHGVALREAAAPRNLRLPFDESRRIKSALAALDVRLGAGSAGGEEAWELFD